MRQLTKRQAIRLLIAWTVFAASSTVARGVDQGSAALAHGEAGGPQRLAISAEPTKGFGARAMSRDGNLVFAGTGPTGGVWDLRTSKMVLTVKHLGTIHAAAFSPDGALLATAAGDWTGDVGRRFVDATVRLWRLSDGSELWRFPFLARHVAFSPDGQKTIAVGESDVGVLLDARTGNKRFSFRYYAVRGDSDDKYIDVVAGAPFSPDGGRFLAIDCANKVANVIDSENGHVVCALKGHTSIIASAVFSPDGTRSLTASWDNTAKTWDSHNDRRLEAFRGHQDCVNTAVFSPDGARVVTASRDGSVRLWDAATGKEVRRWKCGRAKSFVDHAIFCADGSRIFASYRTERVVNLAPEPPYPRFAVLYDAKSGVRVMEFALGRTGAALASGDGKLLLVQPEGGKAKLLKTDTGKLIREY